MTKKFVLLVAAIALISIGVSAQKPVINFPVKNYDFGSINEVDGNATYVFEFTNTGNAALIVQRVSASCGCTTPDWTKTPIEPGKKGTVTVTYNPLGRPGAFVKTISVFSNATNEMETLTINGTVVPRQSEPAPNVYPVQIGDLRLKTKTVQMSLVNKGTTQTRTVAIQNASNSNLNVTIANLPGYIMAVVTPSTLKPNEEGKIDFTFDSQKVNEWGPVNNDVYVVLNGNKNFSDNSKLNVLANVAEDFSKLTIDEKRKSPIMEIKSPNLFFGNIKQGSKVRGKAEIKNNGQRALEVRRIVNNNSEIHITPAKLNIHGGATGTLRIEIDAKNLAEGNYQKSFSVQTNDPSNTYIVYTIGWTVTKK